MWTYYVNTNTLTHLHAYMWTPSANLNSVSSITIPRLVFLAVLLALRQRCWNVSILGMEYMLSVIGWSDRWWLCDWFLCRCDAVCCQWLVHSDRWWLCDWFLCRCGAVCCQWLVHSDRWSLCDWFLCRCGAMCSDEEDSAESTTDEDNVEDNTCQDTTDERSAVVCLSDQRYLPTLIIVIIQFVVFWASHTHTQLFNGPLSRTTHVSQYQKKHSPTHTHPVHQTYFINFLFSA